MTVLLKLAWIGAGLTLSRRTRLFPVHAWLIAASVLRTLAHVWTGGSATLAPLFPWRLSAVPVPIATALIAAWAAQHIVHRLDHSRLRLASWVPALSMGIIAAYAVSGLVLFVVDVQQRRQDPAGSLSAFVERSRASGQVYLIPPRLQEFRLATGAPALVDFKSVPYRDVDVLEWYQRLRLARWFYRDRVEDVNCALLQTARREYGVSHVVLDQDLLSLQCPGLREIYRDPSFVVARLED